MLYYLLSSWKLVQQYPKYSSHLPTCIKNCLTQTTTSPKKQTSGLKYFPLTLNAGWETQVNGEHANFAFICFSSLLLCRSQRITDKCKQQSLPTGSLFSLFSLVFLLQGIMTELVTKFPLIHESPHKALKAHLKNNPKNPALCNDTLAFSERIYFPGPGRLIQDLNCSPPGSWRKLNSKSFVAGA